MEREERERESVCVCVCVGARRRVFCFVNFYSIYSRTPSPSPFSSLTYFIPERRRKGGLGGYCELELKSIVTSVLITYEERTCFPYVSVPRPPFSFPRGIWPPPFHIPLSPTPILILPSVLCCYVPLALPGIIARERGACRQMDGDGWTGLSTYNESARARSAAWGRGVRYGKVWCTTVPYPTYLLPWIDPSIGMVWHGTYEKRNRGFCF